MKNQSFAARFTFALNGLKSAIRTESSFRSQLIMALGVTVILGFLKATPLWWALIFICIGGVLTAEMLNTALEHFIDHIHPERHTAIGIAKDCAAGAVLISSLISVLVFVMFLIEKFA